MLWSYGMVSIKSEWFLQEVMGKGNGNVIKENLHESKIFLHRSMIMVSGTISGKEQNKKWGFKY